MENPNIDYCKFENTLDALRQCYANMMDIDDNASDDEKRAQQNLLLLCKRITDDYKHEIGSILRQRKAQRNAALAKLTQ